MAQDFSTVLDSLNEEQKSAVIHEGSPLLILAGAGSGKTRVITTKIAYLINQKKELPYSILAVTFTKKAANEMRERAINLEPQAENANIKTFHSFGSWFLRKYASSVGLPQSFTVYDDDEMALLIKEVEPSLSAKEANVVSKQISLAKDYCLLPQDDLSIINSEFDLAEIYKKYDKRLRAIGNTDFGDLILLPYLSLKNDEIIANQIHTRFKVILVDEYQDSNIAQYKLLQELSGVNQNNDSYVCVVGDDDQSIYRFRGAEVQNILSFPDQFKGTQIIKLEKNYRSTGAILNAADMIVKNNVNRLGKTLVPVRDEGKMPVLAYLEDQNSEAEFCSEMVLKSIEKKGSYSDWAILYRTNAQSIVLEKEFIKRKIPYKIIGSLKFYEREEIKDILAYLAFFVNKKDIISFKRIINKPGRGIGDKTLDKIIESSRIYNEERGDFEYKDFIETLKTIKDGFSKKALEGSQNFINIFEKLDNYFDKEKSLSEFLKQMIIDSSLEEYHRAGDAIEGTARVQNLHELVNAGSDYECTLEGLVEFLDSINLDRAIDLENEKNNEEFVTLITLHNTKGLEYNKVIITGLEQGVFPWDLKTGLDLEEERRLFYVGITRAKNELYVTSVARRMMYGSYKMMEPSIFLSELKDSFKIIGRKPVAFYPGGYSNFYRSGQSSSNPFKDDSLSEKWKPGVKIFHDDYGYGMIFSAKNNGDEFVIEVVFESGNRKKFLPKYQAKSLTIIKE